MSHYSEKIINDVLQLRKDGKTYKEINSALKSAIPKSTLSHWCKKLPPPPEYAQKLKRLQSENITKARLIAIQTHMVRRSAYLETINLMNEPLSEEIINPNTAKIALAMLCIGQSSQESRATSFYFANSDPTIIMIFLSLFKMCFDINLEKIRCTILCREGQNIQELESFWQDLTKIPKNKFYKTRIDSRSKTTTAGLPAVAGKRIKKPDYKGVLRIDYFDSQVRLELESLAALLYKQLQAQT